MGEPSSSDSQVSEVAGRGWIERSQTSAGYGRLLCPILDTTDPKRLEVKAVWGQLLMGILAETASRKGCDPTVAKASDRNWSKNRRLRGGNGWQWLARAAKEETAC